MISLGKFLPNNRFKVAVHARESNFKKKEMFAIVGRGASALMVEDGMTITRQGKRSSKNSYRFKYTVTTHVTNGSFTGYSLKGTIQLDQLLSPTSVTYNCETAEQLRDLWYGTETNWIVPYDNVKTKSAPEFTGILQLCPNETKLGDLQRTIRNRLNGKRSRAEPLPALATTTAGRRNNNNHNWNSNARTTTSTSSSSSSSTTSSTTSSERQAGGGRKRNRGTASVPTMTKDLQPILDLFKGKSDEYKQFVLNYVAKKEKITIKTTNKKAKVESDSKVLAALKEFMEAAKNPITTTNQHGGGTPPENIRKAMSNLLVILMASEHANIDTMSKELTGKKATGTKRAKWVAAKSIAATFTELPRSEWKFYKELVRKGKFTVAECSAAADFWKSAAVSRQLPSRKNGKERWYRIVTAAEAFVMFKDHMREIKEREINENEEQNEQDNLEETEWTCGLTWFMNQRPAAVGNLMPEQTCLCPYHLRFHYFFEALTKIHTKWHKPGRTGYGANSQTVAAKCTHPRCNAAAPTTERVARHLCGCDRAEAKYLCAPCVDNECDKTTYKHMGWKLDEEETWKKGCKCGEYPFCPAMAKEALQGVDFDITFLQEVVVVYETQDDVKKNKKTFLNKTIKFSKFIEELNEFLPSYLKHHHTSQWQNNEMFQTLCKKVLLDVDGVSMVIDFSENAMHVASQEAQNEHWQHVTSTVFPLVMTMPISVVTDEYFNEQNFTRQDLLDQRQRSREKGFTDVKNVMRVTIGYISEDKSHDKHFVQHVLNDAFRWVQRYTTSKKVFIVSDGAASQFKQTDMMGWCSTVRAKYGFERFEWHFFCSCHGKCLCDPEGGVFKSMGGKYEARDPANHFATSILFFNYLVSNLQQTDEWKKRYVIGIQSRIFRWVPRPGGTPFQQTAFRHQHDDNEAQNGPGSVMRGDTVYYKRTNAKEFLIKKNHSFVYHESGMTVTVRELSCFCDVCESEKSVVVETDGNGTGANGNGGNGGAGGAGGAGGVVGADGEVSCLFLFVDLVVVLDVFIFVVVNSDDWVLMFVYFFIFNYTCIYRRIYV